MDFKRVKLQTKNAITLAWKDHKPWVIGTTSCALISAAIIANAYLGYSTEKKKLDVETVITEVKFPTPDIHYGVLTEEPVVENSIEIFLSMTSQESRTAYKSVLEFSREKDLELKTYHLSQNPEWELSAKTFHTLISLKKDIELEKYFDLFVSLRDSSDLNKKITPLLIQDSIDPTVFTQVLNSIETIQKVNDDLEASTEKGIEFIPSIIIHGNKSIYFGMFDSYKDSLRLFDATKKPTESTPSQEK